MVPASFSSPIRPLCNYDPGGNCSQSTQNHSNYVCDSITSLNSYVDVVKIIVLHIMMVVETDYLFFFFWFVVDNLALLLLCVEEDTMEIE